MKAYGHHCVCLRVAELQSFGVVGEHHEVFSQPGNFLAKFTVKRPLPDWIRGELRSTLCSV